MHANFACHDTRQRFLYSVLVFHELEWDRDVPIFTMEKRLGVFIICSKIASF